MSITLITGGSFVSTGAGQIIPLSGGANYMKVTNLTQSGTQQDPGVGVGYEWWQDQTPQGGGLEYYKSDTEDTLNVTAIKSGGFTYQTSPYFITAPLTGTTITAANPAVATVTNTYSNGDRVRIYGVVGMRQITGMDFTVSSVSSSTITLAGLNASGFAAGATAFQIVKINPQEPVIPSYLTITNISQAANAVVTVSTLHNYVAGMNITFSVPTTYGMYQITNMTGTILSVTAYTLTVNINTSGFTAFAFPASASSIGLVRYATLAPSGQQSYFNVQQQIQYGYNIQQAPFHSSQVIPYMYLAGGANSPGGSASDVVEWQIFRYD
jgi:hypothetical protein